MSRNAEEGFPIYEELYSKGIELIFLKEPHINSSVYRSALDSTINKTEGTLLAGFNLKDAPESTFIDIIFRNSTVNKELAVDENVKPEQIRIVYEEENNEE